VKYPKSNPYSLKEEETHRRNMMIEVEIYQRIGACQYIPRLIHWDPQSCCLTLEYLDKGDGRTRESLLIFDNDGFCRQPQQSRRFMRWI
jgi:hypothetical protein